MPLIKLEKYDLHYGEQIIFDDLFLQLNPGDRLCIVGRNGVGKSTLLKCIQGQAEPDSGERWLDTGVTVAGLAQELPEQNDLSVYDFIAEGMAGVGRDLVAYQHLIEAGAMDLDRLEQLQQRIEAADGWSLQNRIEQVMTRLDLDGSRRLRDLSGGWRRRVALAQALVCEPDVLLLDEPTNHLDIAAIKWLEEYLKNFAGAIVFITHDRAFLRAVANKIAELDRGHFQVWEGNYESFLTFREEQLETESRHNALFDKKLAQEEVWIRQGIKARRTRNEGRVRALKAMREERAQRRNISGTAKIEVGRDGLSGKLVAELKDISFGWDNNKIIDHFSCTIIRGDKIGLIGPNGIGKSTLLKIILGDLQPQSGQVRLGSKLSIAYFDQTREQLDLEKNAIDNIAGGRDFIDINGKSRHIISYLQDFLFSGERARTPIKALSGGERNRILLAKLFSKPCNLLIMDEPTNDLDAETLELLESLLMEFDGTLLLVSHDREFLDNVITSSIAFEGNGKLVEYVGGYTDWVNQGGIWPTDTSGAQPSPAEVLKAPEKPASDKTAGPEKTIGSVKTTAPSKTTKKISYKLQRELDSLPAELEALESELEKLQKEISSPDFYQGDPQLVADKLQKLTDKQAFLQNRYARWEELESMVAE